MKKPYIVALGGTTRAGSSTQKALALCLREVAALGADTHLVSGADLDLPPYTPGAKLPVGAESIVAELRRADGLIVGTPGYHGGISGLVKNALDYVEELRSDARPYLEGRAVGCVVTAAGEQGAVSTLLALRSVVHALRGWPTPLGAAIVTVGETFDASGDCMSERIDVQLKTLSQQVFYYANLQRCDAQLGAHLLRCPPFG
ncbi:NADPH-dependent FMN reductase [Bradyrhizobium erythrophlei]|uniref:FMN reductase n=1 Tax=Bradyrhizobium erythrophlei TaxID=1437360 RepID=A0A1H5GA55_9BRAD|nr:NAD(P)H-dependent oxidoreductase [Bradyrhizobium erythrophlei]SEE12593.1 FMN reductase [Bradyrhizobium erythrophlei]